MKKAALIVGFVLIATLLMAIEHINIRTIQYSTSSYDSPYEGTDVITTGLVTCAVQGKFFIQDGNADWSGLCVISNEALSMGDMVEVEGRVEEEHCMTIIMSTRVTVTSSANQLPFPKRVTTLQIATDGEAYESMLVSIQDIGLEIISSSYAKANDGSGECKISTELADGDISLGKKYSRLSGICQYGFGEFFINPRSPYDLTQTTLTAGSNNSWGRVKYKYR